MLYVVLKEQVTKCLCVVHREQVTRNEEMSTNRTKCENVRETTKCEKRNARNEVAKDVSKASSCLKSSHKDSKIGASVGCRSAIAPGHKQSLWTLRRIVHGDQRQVAAS